MKRRFLSLWLVCLLLVCIGTEAVADGSVKPLVFETLTLEGKEISSKELFHDHAVTVVNVWTTWCKPCIEELEELSALHIRLQKDGCGVIGILWDGDSAQEKGLEITQEKGVSYPILLPCEEMEFLAELRVFPTTFFVDSEGCPVADAIEGAKVAQYEQTVLTLLDKKAAGTAGSTVKAADSAAGAGNNAQMPEKNTGEPTRTSAPEGMRVVCDGESCTLVPVETDSGTDLPPDEAESPDPSADDGKEGTVADSNGGQDVPTDPEESRSEEKTQTEGEDIYPACPFKVVYLDTKIIAVATGEYAGMDGEHPDLP